MTEPSFRDFAGAVMRQDRAAAAATLGVLLALPADRAEAATAHFAAAMAAGGPAFVSTAMGLRTVVQAGDPAAIAATLTTCFGLPPGEADRAAAHLRGRHAGG